MSDPHGCDAGAYAPPDSIDPTGAMPSAVPIPERKVVEVNRAPVEELKNIYVMKSDDASN